VIGFTVSKAQHDYARRQSVAGPRPDLRLQDFLANGLPDASVDAAVAVESLTHMADPARAVREAARVLRPEGRFVACVWMATPSPPAWARRYLLDPICAEGRLSGLPTPADLRRWTRTAGLTVERLDDVTPLVRRTWTVVIRRFGRALVTDPAVLRFLLDATESERVFARTLPRIWLAQHLGVLRYGWLVASRQ
jgi:tocopherol O-methyltransferase